MLLSLTLARLFTGSSGGRRTRRCSAGWRSRARTGQGLLAPAFQCMRGFVAHELGRLDVAEADEEEALEAALISGNVAVAYWASIQSELDRARARAAGRGARARPERVGPARRPRRLAGGLQRRRRAARRGRSARRARRARGVRLGQPAAVDARPGEGRRRRRARAARARPRRGRAGVGAPRAGRRWRSAHAACAARSSRTPRRACCSPPATRGRRRASRGPGSAAADAASAPLWAGRCRTLGAEALAAAGHDERARGEARRAASELGACGAWGYRDAALRVLRRLGERPRPAGEPAPRRSTTASPR